MQSIDETIGRHELQMLSKEELIGRVLSMQSHIKQLKNILTKRKSDPNESKPEPKSGRNFDFAKYKSRHIAIKLLYLGWGYCGFAAQEGIQKTIESELFEALIRTRLIQSRQTSNYHRCGRTDKGVSAFSQVVSIDVRSNLKYGKGVIEPDVRPECEDNCQTNDTNDFETQEINYTLILNNVLPKNIRVVCWAPVQSDFSARFNCIARTYKYLFPKANLDLEVMRIGANYLLGEHDFRNVCKMDVNNGVVNYKRTIMSVHLEQISNINGFNETLNEESYGMCSLTITGSAFLWHQIRCVVALLFLIGQRREEPEIIEKLLDVNLFPNKPQYSMSADFPLLFFDCVYRESELKDWIYDMKALDQLIRHLQSLWTEKMVKTNVIKLIIESLTHEFSAPAQIESTRDMSALMAPIYSGHKNKIYKPLLERPVCESLEQRMSKNKKNKKKIKKDNEIKIN